MTIQDNSQEIINEKFKKKKKRKRKRKEHRKEGRDRLLRSTGSRQLVDELLVPSFHSDIPHVVADVLGLYKKINSKFEKKNEGSIK